MRKILVGVFVSVLVSVASPAMASLVNVNTTNTVHPNNDLRCSSQCLDVDASVGPVTVG